MFLITMIFNIITGKILYIAKFTTEIKKKSEIFKRPLHKINK